MSSLVILQKQENDLPMWGNIREILIVGGNCPLLYVEKYITVGLNNHLMSHAICRTHTYEILLISTLTDKYPYTAHSCIGDRHLYIAIRSDVLL